MDTPYTDDSNSILKELGLEQDSSDEELEPEVEGDNIDEDNDKAPTTIPN